MRYPIYFSAVTLAMFSLQIGGAQAFDEAKYPNLKGQWRRVIIQGTTHPSLDPTKSGGYEQGAPLTPEYKAVFEQSLADQAIGKQGNLSSIGCLPFGMPMMMTAFYGQEYVVTQATTHIIMYAEDHGRRVFTDGRDWPRDLEPTYSGYSVGKWIDEDGDSKFDVLEVETRGPFKGQRSYDSTGLPLHHDNQSIFKERFFLDKSDPNILHDVITVFDHALTRPWTVDKRFQRIADERETWPEVYCPDNNQHVLLGKEDYFVSADGHLMPSRKDQPPPDLRYFKQSGK
jgi:hypothetical protein